MARAEAEIVSSRENVVPFGAADSLSIAIEERSDSSVTGWGRWVVEAEALLEGIGWSYVGAVQTLSPGSKRSRVVAVASVPGARGWRVRFSAASSPELCAVVSLGGSSCCARSAGLMSIPAASTPRVASSVEIDADSQGVVGSLVVSTGPGRLLEVRGTNATGGTLFVQPFDATAAPAPGTAATIFPIEVPATAAVFERKWSRPLRFSTGIVLVASSTVLTYTPAAASFWLAAQAEAG